MEPTNNIQLVALNIKFRGISICDHKKGEFVYGSLLNGGKETFIVIISPDLQEGQYPQFVSVDPESVGQSSGVLVKDGAELFTGDIIKDESSILWVIFWEIHQCGFHYQLVNPPKKKFDGRIGQASYRLQDWLFKQAELVGNIHQNKDLFKSKKKRS